MLLNKRCTNSILKRKQNYMKDREKMKDKELISKQSRKETDCWLQDNSKNSKRNKTDWMPKWKMSKKEIDNCFWDSSSRSINKSKKEEAAHLEEAAIHQEEVFHLNHTSTPSTRTRIKMMMKSMLMLMCMFRERLTIRQLRFINQLTWTRLPFSSVRRTAFTISQHNLKSSIKSSKVSKMLYTVELGCGN